MFYFVSVKQNHILILLLYDILSLDILNFSSLDDFPYYLLWKNRGVQFVSDLINHENKQFYSFEQIQEKLETNNFLKFYRLIARILKAFKDCLKENLLDIHFDTHDTTDTFVKKIVSNKLEAQVSLYRSPDINKSS
jgi:hypothetical protein